jgi:hypothetical protein
MSSTSLLARGATLASLAALAWACCAPIAVVHAQTPPPDAQQGEAASPRQNQKMESIHVEDAGAKVDEVRYGGRTQSITVSPKANVPSYEVLPEDGRRSRQSQQESGATGNGPRVWNVLKF